MKKSWIAAPLGAGIGAAVMYLFDPERGKRRRALVRDKFAHATHASAQKAGVASRDVANHLRGAIARARSKVTSKSVPDSVLAERVRARIGHVIPHAGSIDVTVRDGRVILAGPTVEGSLDALLSEVARVRGVAGIDNRLGVPDEPQGASQLPASAPSAAFPVEGRRGEDVTTVS